MALTAVNIYKYLKKIHTSPMISKVYNFFMILSIAESAIPSFEIVYNEFDKFVQNLILNHCNSDTYVGIFHDNKRIYEMNIPQLLEDRHIPVILHDFITPEISYNSSEEWIPKIPTRMTNYNIIITEDAENFSSILEIMKRIPFFSTRTNLLVILTNRVNSKNLQIRNIFSQLWKIYALNIGLIFYTSTVNLFTYLPWTVPYKIQNLTNQGTSANVFYDKLKNLHKYPVKILCRNFNTKMIAVNKNNSTTYLGIDGMTMTTFLEHYNATSKMIILEPNKFEPCRFISYDGTIRGMLGADIQNISTPICPYSPRLPRTLKRPSELKIIQHDIDLSFDSRALRHDMDYRVDTSFSNMKDSFCIIVPAPTRFPQALNLLLPLGSYAWLTIILNFVVHIFIYFGIRMETGGNRSRFFNGCFILYKIQVINSGPNPKKLKPLEKTYLLCWVLYSFFITAAYQSVLISFITVPLYNPPLNYIKELKSTDFRIFGPSEIVTDMYNIFDKETSSIFFEKMEVNVDIDELKFDVRNAYLLEESIADYIVQRKDFIDKTGRPLFHRMKECPIPLYVSYQMPRGSPFLKLMDKFMFMKTQAGLMTKWHTDAMRYLNSLIPQIEEYEAKVVKLTMSHLQGAFYILFIGLTLGTSTFLFEFYWK